MSTIFRITVHASYKQGKGKGQLLDPELHKIPRMLSLLSLPISWQRNRGGHTMLKSTASLHTSIV